MQNPRRGTEEYELYSTGDFGRIEQLRERAEELGLPTKLRKKDVYNDSQVAIDGQEVSVRGQRVKLSPTELRLLYALVTRPNETLSYAELIGRVWGLDYEEEKNGSAKKVLKTHIHYLRYKIGEGLIETVRHVGYGYRGN